MSERRAIPRPGRFARVVSALLLAGALAGCTQNDDLAAQYRSGSGQGFISGDFSVMEIPPDERGDPVDFEGVTETGATVSSDDYVGRVYVVNFWYAACGPCRAEAPLLQQVWQEHEADDVGFLGVNIYDQPANAIAFAETYGITYPSLMVVDDVDTKAAFAAATSLQAVPTTLVLDREGRVAARIIGQLDAASILFTLISDTLAEPV